MLKHACTQTQTDTHRPTVYRITPFVVEHNNGRYFIFSLRTAGIRGEDAGTLVCYKKDDETQPEEKARLELTVLGK